MADLPVKVNEEQVIPNEIERLLDENFAPTEALVGKLLISVKAHHGLAARIEGVAMDFLMETNYNFDTKVEKRKVIDAHSAAHFNVADYQKQKIYEIGEVLGIQRQRIDAINDFVYNHETKL